MNPVRQHDLAAERALIGAVLINSEAYWAPASYVVRDRDFYDPAHRIVWQALAQLASEGRPFDSLSLQGQLEQTKQLERVGGIETVLGFTDTLPSDATVERNAHRVRQLSVVRTVFDAALRVASEASEPIDDMGAFLDRAEVALTKACSERLSTSGAVHVSEIVQGVYEQIVAQSENRSASIGIPTGLHDIDKVIGGAVECETTIIAGRPGMGKSAFAMRKALGIAMHAPVYVASLEMEKRMWGRRILSSESGVDGNKIRTARLSKDDMSDIGDAAARVERMPIYVNDNGNATMLDIRRDVRRIEREIGRKFGAVFIDYAQIVKSTERSDNREQEVAAISLATRQLCKEARCHVYALAQLNRSVDSRADKRPVLSDLRESGSLEQDADNVMFVYRDEVYDTASKDKGKAEIIIAKQRSGETGTVVLAWDGARTRFDNLARDWQ